MPVVENYVLAAIHNSRKLPQADVEAQLVSLRAHLDFLLSGAPNADVSWRSMADVSNVTETLSGMRIGSGPERDTTCKHCHGTGGDPWNDGILPCEHCDGEGYEWWN